MNASTPSVWPVVVVGSGLAGWTTVREFRKRDAQTPVLLISADDGDFYAKPSLSNAMALGRTPEQLVTTPAGQMAQAQGVTLWARCTVQGLDTTARRLRTSQGDVAYERLVLATGARAIRVPLQGDAADRVLSVNSLDDYRHLRRALDALEPKLPARVLIMGAGLIGCEFANDLAQAGHAVTVVDPGPRALAALLPEDASAALQAALGGLPVPVQWRWGETVQAVDAALPKGVRVTLTSGATLQADVVLSAIGLRPDVELARQAGLELERGICVDEGLQTSAAGVYALGDGAQYASAGSRPLPFVMPIMHAARVLAARLHGQDERLVFPPMPVAIKTPALPVQVLTPPPGTSGGWRREDEGVWAWWDEQGVAQGFALTGEATRQRQAWVARVQTQARGAGETPL